MCKLSWLGHSWLSWVVVGKNVVVSIHVTGECVLYTLWLLKVFHNASWGAGSWERKDEFHFWSLCNNVCNTNVLRFFIIILHLLYCCGTHMEIREQLCLWRELSSSTFIWVPGVTLCLPGLHCKLVNYLANPDLVFWIWISLTDLTAVFQAKSCVSSKLPFCLFFFFCLWWLRYW